MKFRVHLARKYVGKQLSPTSRTCTIQSVENSDIVWKMTILSHLNALVERIRWFLWLKRIHFSYGRIKLLRRVTYHVCYRDLGQRE